MQKHREKRNTYILGFLMFSHTSTPSHFLPSFFFLLLGGLRRVFCACAMLNAQVQGRLKGEKQNKKKNNYSGTRTEVSLPFSTDFNISSTEAKQQK